MSSLPPSLQRVRLVNCIAAENNSISVLTRIKSSSNPCYFKVKAFNKHKFLICHILFIGTSAVLKRGTYMWPSRRQIVGNINDLWNLIVKVTDFGEYIPEYQFKMYKSFIPSISEFYVKKSM